MGDSDPKTSRYRFLHISSLLVIMVGFSSNFHIILSCILVSLLIWKSLSYYFPHLACLCWWTPEFPRRHLTPSSISQLRFICDTVVDLGWFTLFKMIRYQFFRNYLLWAPPREPTWILIYWDLDLIIGVWFKHFDVGLLVEFVTRN